MNSFIRGNIDIVNSANFSFAIDDLCQAIKTNRKITMIEINKLLNDTNYIAFIIDKCDTIGDLSVLCEELIKNNEMVIIGTHLMDDSEKIKEYYKYLVELFERKKFSELKDVYEDRIVFVKNSILGV